MSSNELSRNESSSPPRATSEGELFAIREFALQHLIAATLFTEKCAEIEHDDEGKQEDVCSYASGAIMSSVAGLEAYINEEYLSRLSPIRKAIPNFEEEFYKKNGIERKPILCKYQLALKLLKTQKLNKGSTEYKNAKNLIALRDTLVHFKPFWDKGYQNVGLQEKLKDEFEMSPSFNSSVSVSNSDFAATNCMTCSCGEWALKTSYKFIKAFSSQPGFRDKWKELTETEYVNKLTKYPNKLTEYLDKLAIDT